MSGLKDHFLGDTFASEYIPAFQPHSETSREAAHSIAPRVTDLQRRVLDFIVEHYGATDEQIIDAIGLSPSTVRPRRIELVNLKLIQDSGRYALTRSGRRATLWIFREVS